MTDSGGSVTNIGSWAAREAGTLGNSIKVSLCSNSTAFGVTLTKWNFISK